MKTLFFASFRLLVMCMMTTMVVLSGCTKDPEMISENNSQLQESTLKFSGSITDEEISSLMFMVEEEKLAGDVYLKLFEMHGLAIFDNIYNSETRHVNAVSKLIDKFELDNPISGNPPGVFENEDLQALYKELIILGSVSKKFALIVGVTIEEKDLEDIQAYIDYVVERKDIEQVYTNLLNGSINHLEAFNQALLAKTTTQ